MYLLTNVDEHRYAAPASSDIPYVIDIFPLNAGLAAIATDQTLSLFDPSALRGKGAIRTLRTPHANITVASPFDQAQSTVCTAGSDGTVAIWDLRAGAGQVTRQIGTAPTSIGSLACCPGANMVAVGTEYENNQASIVIWDIRTQSAPVIQYNEVHSDDITELNFHPADNHTLLSGSTDGLVNVYDLRVTDEDEVIVQTLNHGASVHHAGFLNRTEVFALSHDEKLAFFDLAEEQDKGVATADFGDMRQVAQCQYIANVLPKADPSGASGAVLGAGLLEQEKFELLHFSKGATWNFDTNSSVGLPGAHGSEVVRAFRVFDAERVVFTAGEDGRIKAWRPGS
ncbi:hypothetical protein MCOR25_008778 [Pyricularia grisea]|nr:hypothetical protein MCOR25_008778 [Pyricularia grisea]